MAGSSLGDRGDRRPAARPPRDGAADPEQEARTGEPASPPCLSASASAIAASAVGVEELGARLARPILSAAGPGPGSPAQRRMASADRRLRPEARARGERRDSRPAQPDAGRPRSIAPWPGRRRRVSPHLPAADRAGGTVRPRSPACRGSALRFERGLISDVHRLRAASTPKPPFTLSDCAPDAGAVVREVLRRVGRHRPWTASRRRGRVAPSVPRRPPGPPGAPGYPTGRRRPHHRSRSRSPRSSRGTPPSRSSGEQVRGSPTPPCVRPG